MTYKQAAELIIRRRAQEVRAAEILYTEALKQDNELLQVETKLRKLELTAVKSGQVDHGMLAALTKQRNGRLQSLGLSTLTTAPAPHCAKCGDTARKDGAFCDCVRVLALGDGKNLEIPCKSFSEIEYGRFDAVHRQRNQKIYEDVQKIAEKFPQNKRRIITVLGSTGTGKTLLAGCTATALLDRGFAVAAVTAFGFVNRALRYHTTFDDEKLSHLEPLLDSDFLIIDDLGTESILKNVTLEYLLNVVNERICTGKLTMITTNLSPDGILARYGERLYSRLFDKTLAYTNILNGKDMRTS